MVYAVEVVRGSGRGERAGVGEKLSACQYACSNEKKSVRGRDRFGDSVSWWMGSSLQADSVGAVGWKRWTAVVICLG